MDSGDVRTVDVHVRRLREKIEPSPSDLSLYIQNGALAITLLQNNKKTRDEIS